MMMMDLINKHNSGPETSLEEADTYYRFGVKSHEFSLLVESARIFHNLDLILELLLQGRTQQNKAPLEEILVVTNLDLQMTIIL